MTKETSDASHAQTARACEIETVRQSIRNLMTFPWIDKRVRTGELSLHGWHFDIAEGDLYAVDGSAEPVLISG